MPFATEFDDVYEHVIRSVLTEAGYTVSRADESNGPRNIMHDVIQGIIDADLVIADLSGSNPNVYYELGIAHALNRRVVLLTQDIDEIPFDLRAYRVVTYSTHFARVAEAKSQISEIAAGAKNGTLHFGSPVSDFGITAQPSLVNTDRVSSQSSVVSPQSADDMGPLDVAADFEDGMSEITTLLSDFAERLNNTLRPNIVKTTEDVTGPLKHNPRELRLSVRSLATEMDGFAHWLKEANARYRRALQTLTTIPDLLFTVGVTDRGEALAEIPKLLEVIESGEAGAIESKASMASLINTLDTLPRIEKEFNRAKRRFSEEIQSLVSNIDQTIAVMGRTAQAAKQFQAGSDAI